MAMKYMLLVIVERLKKFKAMMIMSVNTIGAYTKIGAERKQKL